MCWNSGICCNLARSRIHSSLEEAYFGIGIGSLHRQFKKMAVGERKGPRCPAFLFDLLLLDTQRCPDILLALDTNQPLRLEYNSRSVFTILSSCLATVFACTWVSVHPNVPPPTRAAGPFLAPVSSDAGSCHCTRVDGGFAASSFWTLAGSPEIWRVQNPWLLFRHGRICVAL
ncbi:hypothetical protein B0H12DRAFT_1279783 [Mycena haematopus]|nr:hypothetical protein B0H12DRAFT_1279783 [Mycena haematopus]